MAQPPSVSGGDGAFLLPPQEQPPPQHPQQQPPQLQSQQQQQQQPQGTGAHRIVVSDVCTRGDDGRLRFIGMTIWDACSRASLRAVIPLVLEDRSLLEEKDESGQTPMHAAARAGARPVLEFLLEQGGDVDSRDTAGLTPLMHAARANQTQCTVFLLGKGADAAAVCNQGRHVLCHAAKSPLCLHLIVRSGGGNTPLPHDLLHAAAEEGEQHSVRYCLEQLKIDANAVDPPTGDTALHCAARAGRPLVAGILAECGADAEASNRAGDTALSQQAAAAHARSGDVARRVRAKNGAPDNSNRRVLFGAENLGVAAAAFSLPNLSLMVAAKLPPVLGFAALVANLSMVGFITKRAASKRKPDPGLAGWYAGGLTFGSYVLVQEVFPHVDAPLYKQLWVVATALMFVCYLRALLMDPGVVASTRQDREALYASVTPDGSIDTKEFCTTTFARKPFRSKFCSTCLRLVHRFDHYCVWTCNAIGGGNVRWFFAFATFQVASQVGVTAFAATHLRQHKLYPEADRLYPCTWFDFFFHPDIVLCTFFLVCYNLAVFLFIASVFVTQFFFISRNITSNEVWFPERYTWCFMMGTRAFTLYDKGFMGNWREFICGNLTCYDRTTPPMSAHLTSRVAQWTQYTDRKEALHRKRLEGLPLDHPARQGLEPAAARSSGCCDSHGRCNSKQGQSPKEALASVVQAVQAPAAAGANASQMIRDAETGLLMPAPIAAYLQSLPADKRFVLAAEQRRQFTELGLVAEDGAVLPITEANQEVVTEALKARLKRADQSSDVSEQHATRSTDELAAQHPVATVAADTASSAAHLRARTNPARSASPHAFASEGTQADKKES